jgi:hypothetical protein
VRYTALRSADLQTCSNASKGFIIAAYDKISSQKEDADTIYASITEATVSIFQWLMCSDGSKSYAAIAVRTLMAARHNSPTSTRTLSLIPVVAWPLLAFNWMLIDFLIYPLRNILTVL